MHHRLQLESCKNLLEIELDEKLRRRRDELRGKIDTFSTSGQQQSTVEDIDGRKAELKQLRKQIDDLTAKLDGQP